MKLQSWRGGRPGQAGNYVLFEFDDIRWMVEGGGAGGVRQHSALSTVVRSPTAAQQLNTEDNAS